MDGMGLFLHFLLNVHPPAGTKKTYPTKREVRKIIIDSQVPAIVREMLVAWRVYQLSLWKYMHIDLDT